MRGSSRSLLPARSKRIGALADDLGLGDLAVIEAVVGAAMVAQQLPREQDVLRGHRLAVGKSRAWIEREGDVAAGGIGLDRAGDEAVKRERLVIAARHQAFDHITADHITAADERAANTLGNQALHDERIEAVEAAEHAFHQAAALGRIRIDVGRRFEVLGQGRLAVHRNGIVRFSGVGRCPMAPAEDEGKKAEEGADAPPGIRPPGWT